MDHETDYSTFHEAPLESQDVEEVAGPAEEESGRPRRWRTILWATLWAIFPPVLIVCFLYYVMKPAIRGKEPSGAGYVLWVLGLIFLGTIFMMPFGSMTKISEALQNPSTCRSLLTADVIASLVTIGLIVLTFRKQGIPNPYVPITRFRLDWKVSLLWFLSLLPLVTLLLPPSAVADVKQLGHPVMIAFANCFRAGFYGSALMGFVSVVVVAPILEESVFRGLLVEKSHDLRRRKSVRRLLDLLVCAFFAALHLPVAFVIPFLLAAAFIYVRRRTGSLVPSMVMHASWNYSVLVAVIWRYV
jgi:membrane protease YdiL (CAAX protease family)